MLGFALIVVLVLAAFAFSAGGCFQPLLPIAVSFIFAFAFYFGVSTYGFHARDWIIIALTLLAFSITLWQDRFGGLGAAD